MTIEFNRKQKDYLDKIEARLAWRYGNERKLYQAASSSALQNNINRAREAVHTRKASSGSDVSMQKIYKVELRANRSTVQKTSHYSNKQYKENKRIIERRYKATI